MNRIYSTYSQSECNTLKAEAKKRGMTVSAYQRYLVLLSLPKIEPPETPDLKTLVSDMYNALSQRDCNDPFIVSSLFDSTVWSALDASQKRTLAMQLSHHIRKHPEQFARYGTLPGKITQYIKLPTSKA